MDRDRVSDSSGQGPSNIRHQHSSLTESLFGKHIDQCWIAESGNWDGSFYSEDAVKAFSPDNRHHFCCALMKQGATSRDKANFDGAILFVLDDVGTVAAPGSVSITGSNVSLEMVKLFAPDGFYAVETSKGNFQTGWRIEVEYDIARWEYFIRQMAQHPQFGRGVHDVVHYFRMETGSGKPVKGAFQTRLAKDWDGTVWKLDDLAAAFGIDMDPALVAASTVKLASGPSGDTVSEALAREITGLLPNGDKDKWFDDRNVWIGIAHALRNTLGEAVGRDVWLDWNAQRTQKGGEPERVWDTLPPDSTNDINSLRQWLINVYGETSTVFAGIVQKIADEQAPLTAIDEADVPEAVVSPAVAGLKLDELLREIRKTQVVPKHHQNGDGPHWLQGGKVRTMREVLKAGTVAPPVIVTPYERGLMSVLAGMPGLGKSLLALHQALAITYGRPDLIRYGQPKLQFPGDVIYISNEDGLGLLARRTQAWLQQHGLEQVVPPHELIPLKSTLLTYDGTAWQPKCLEVLEAVLEYVRGGRDVAMIVVDTLATSVSGVNENTSDMAPVMAFLDQLSKVFWASVVFIHHVNKASVGEEDRSIIAIRGWSGVTGAVRGAVTLTPANGKEVDEYGWAGKSVIAEYVAKANDDRARYVACYYEQLAVGIPVGDAVDPTVSVTQDTAILVPLKPQKMVDDMAAMRGYRDLLEVAIKAGKQVRRYAANARNTGPKSAHHILGVSVKQAFEIVEKLASLDQVTVEMVFDREANEKVPTVVLVAPRS